MNHPFLVIFVKITIFSLMLAIGINLSFEKMLSFWRKPALLFRDILAVVVIVPLVVIIFLKLFHLPPDVMTGLALLAASPGAPLTTKRSQMARGKLPSSASLQLTLALMAVFITPITLAIFTALFNDISQKVTVLEVVKQITMVQFLPVIIGILLQKFGSKYAEMIAKPISTIANGLFLVLIIIGGIAGLPILFKVSGLS
ncbi:bile acid:sodium symporter family protein [Geminocystis sp. NIES-3709]|uniref:bile acid:sodium symporter family protein n=1 Tax=Geminocystis sp. NIES-3709 TaxID=1617448 RepID=UPI0005FCACFA|nr:bile acid:sodium symporter [Geminocystis sp. NIES-3709]BAQ64129.1 possible sodium dependent transporter [Geminocystis sp. NIES-3709]